MFSSHHAQRKHHKLKTIVSVNNVHHSVARSTLYCAPHLAFVIKIAIVYCCDFVILQWWNTVDFLKRHTPYSTTCSFPVHRNKMKWTYCISPNEPSLISFKISVPRCSYETFWSACNHNVLLTRHSNGEIRYVVIECHIWHLSNRTAAKVGRTQSHKTERFQILRKLQNTPWHCV